MLTQCPSSCLGSMLYILLPPASWRSQRTPRPEPGRCMVTCPFTVALQLLCPQPPAVLLGLLAPDRAGYPPHSATSATGPTPHDRVASCSAAALALLPVFRSCFLLGLWELGNLETVADLVSLFRGQKEVIFPLAKAFPRTVAGSPSVERPVNACR